MKLTTNLHLVTKLRIRTIFSPPLCFKDIEIIFITFVSTHIIVRVVNESFVRVFIQTSLIFLKTKRNLLDVRNQSVPRCKHFPPRL